MSKCAVVIGVDNVAGLPPLSAAASGAREFAKWADSQGFQVKVLTDNQGKTVSVGEVKAAVGEFVQQRTFSQMVVFFSGHGVLKAAETEMCLLSNALQDGDEAINIFGSIVRARNSGISHIVVISDACRSRPDTHVLAQVQGSCIFPSGEPKRPVPPVDIFYASIPGEPSLEAPSAEAGGRYRGVFTEQLLKALRGEVPEVISDLGQASVPRWVVPSENLEQYLEEKVPQIVSDIDVKLQQTPDIRVESHFSQDRTKYLATVTAWPTANPAPAPPPGKGPSADFIKPVFLRRQSEPSLRRVTRSLREDRLFRSRDMTRSTADNVRDSARHSELAHDMDKLEAVRGRQSFETRNWFHHHRGKRGGS